MSKKRIFKRSKPFYVQNRGGIDTIRRIKQRAHNGCNLHLVGIVTPIILRATLVVNSIGLRPAYVKTRKPNVSQSSSDNVLQKRTMKK